jgi:hypothetical protein
MPTDPKPAPTTDLATIRYLLTLPGWLTVYCGANPADDEESDCGEPSVSDEHIAGASWTGHGYTLTMWRHPHSTTISCLLRAKINTPKDVRELAPSWPHSGAEEIDSAVMWAIRTRALIEHVVATALAAAAPPTTIAELATRPGWRLDDGEAIHDGAYIVAGPNIVELGLGDRVHALDEREAAEVAFAIAPLIAAAHVRYNANPDQE